MVTREHLTLKEYLREALGVAATLAVIGAFLLSRDFESQRWETASNYLGWAFIFFASALAVWGLVSLFVAVLAVAFRQTWRFLWRLLEAAWSGILGVYSRLLGFMLRPAVLRALQTEGSTTVTRFDWKAHQWRLYPTLQRADFRSAAQLGLRVRSISFCIRPDYRHYYWRAGFRLGPIDDDFAATPIAERLLFSVSMNQREAQPHAILHWSNIEERNIGLTHYAGGLRPSFRVEANIWSTPDEGLSQIEISVDNEAFMQRRIPSGYAERVTFLAWADGREFTVYFDSVKIRWTRS